MRGSVDPQAELMCFVNLEKKVPPEHPLRGIMRLADAALRRLNPSVRHVVRGGRPIVDSARSDRKSTRLNSSH